MNSRGPLVLVSATAEIEKSILESQQLKKAILSVRILFTANTTS